MEGGIRLCLGGDAAYPQIAVAVNFLVRLALIFLPFFVLCIAAGGYLIIRKTLAPLADIDVYKRQPLRLSL